MATFSKRIQLRRDTATNWASENPVLLEGELGIELDSNRNRIKIGDGSTAWNSLPYSWMHVKRKSVITKTF